MENKYDSLCSNMQVFDAVKKIERAKVIKRRIVKAIIPVVAGLGVTFVLAMPYINSNNTINEFMEANQDDVAYVGEASESSASASLENEVIDDGVPWGKPSSKLKFGGDVVGYLSDRGDVLDNRYPITQSSSDNPDFYIDHDINGDYSDFGNMYKDSRNHRGLSDDVTVIYGHNLINGSMFGTLKNYADKDGYLGDNEGQKLYNREKREYGSKGNSLTYIDEYGEYRLDLVYAGVYDGADVLSLVGNFETDKDRELAIKLFKKGSDIKSDVSFDEDSKIVILQTCEDGDSATYGQGNKRIYAIYKAKQKVRYKNFDDVKQNTGKSLS